MFDPSLPIRHIRGIESLGFGLINKVFLDFEEPWWDSDVAGIQFLWRTEDEISSQSYREKPAQWTRDFTGFDVMSDHRAVLLGWIGGKGARIVETLSEEQVRI